MGKSTKDAYGATGVFNGLWLDPLDVLIVGYDKAAPEVEDLEDPDRLSGPVDPALVASVMAHSIRVPITVRKVGEHVLVVDGRQRIRAAREANKRLGDDAKVLIPAIVDKGGDLLTSMVITNEHRKEDGVIAKARKMQRMAERGHKAEAIGLCFGVKKSTVANMLSLMSADADVIQAVEDGRIPASVGYELARMTLPDQSRALKELLASGAAVKGDAGVANARALRDGGSADEEGEGEGESTPRLVKAGKVAGAAQIKGLALLFAPDEDGNHANNEEEAIYAVLLAITTDEGADKALKVFPDIKKKVRRVIKAQG